MQIIGKVSKWGNSLGLRINQEMAESLQLDAGSQVSLELDEVEHVLIVSPIQQKKIWAFKESELLDGMRPENAHAELLTSPLDSEIN